MKLNHRISDKKLTIFPIYLCKYIQCVQTNYYYYYYDNDNRDFNSTPTQTCFLCFSDLYHLVQKDFFNTY